MFRILMSSILAVVSLAPAPAAAQTGGTVTGRVTIALNGDPVHGATIIIVGARRTATTGDDGRFSIANVPAGTYEVLAQREHLSAGRQTITVEPGGTATLDFALELTGGHEEVTVTASATGAATAFESFNSIISLDSFEIARHLGTTVADVLQHEPGVARRSFGPGSSRPIIRGFDGDRVLIMQDGVRTGDLSSQSGDHGISIDAAGLSRLEVVKGPATLLYGSNAIGGVVNAISPQDAFRATPFSGTLGGMSVDAGSANGQAGGSGNVQHGTGPWLVFGNFTSRRTGDYESPAGSIPNSGTRLVTGEGGVGWSGARAFFGVSGGLEHNRYGVPYAGFFEGDPDAEVDLDAERRQARIDAGLRNLGGSFADTLRVTVSLLDYAHDEIEIEDGVETLGTRFENTVGTARAELEQKRVGRLNGRIGVELFSRDYRATGEEALAPPTVHRSVSGFAYEELQFGPQRVQFGARVEHNRYNSSIDRQFTGVSGSLGLHRDLGATGALVVNLTGATRAPALEELYNFGPHIGNLSFERGNVNLAVERTLGVDMSLRSRAERINGEINVFTYGISNFVFLDVTDEIEDGLRVADYTQADSRFTGAEASGHVELTGWMTLDASIAAVRARLTATGEPLPRIPPVRGRFELSFSAGPFTINPEAVFSARQSNVFRHESPTAGWGTLDLNVSWQRLGSHSSHLIALQAHNLLDTTYRLHTSFLKDLAPEIGRGLKLTYTMRFF
jgi:iron complex outermembrane receptor protein